jgi:L-aspartate oxidase
MSRHAAIGRDRDGLAEARAELDRLTTRQVPHGRPGHEAAALTLAAQAILIAAEARTESRGCHVRTDFPDRDDVNWRRSLLVRLGEDGAPEIAGTRPAVNEEIAV